MSPELAASIGGTSGKGNRTDQYKDYGFELGGPILKDRLWAWGAIGKTHVESSRSTGTHDRTELQDTSFKADGADHQRHPRELHLLPRQQGEVRPQRRPDAADETT